ncbi:MAG TPA: GTPase ObgE [Fibrobacteria bacterium]|jgi:GTP-binding protein|nr:GTPase ObgE [Fibrobacteria bacterium]
MFLDETTIEVVAGKGGDGMVSFRHEKFVPMGGPSGGNGGRGGHVILKGSKDLHTLYDIGQARIFRAENGDKGGTGDCTGRSGEDLIILLPAGTLVKDADTGEVLADLKRDGQTAIIAEGGRGGAGNTAFKSSRNQAPRQSTPGAQGGRRRLAMELKLLADCGLVGFPNAGKSSLIRAVSSATPKVADYPFTTIKPALGVVSVAPGASFVLVDIPGIIEGAAEGKGLGHRFLRHIERTRCLVFTLDASGDDPYAQYKVLRKELEKFHPLLLEKPKLIVLSKCDLGDFAVDKRFKKEKCPVLKTSSATGLGLTEFKREAFALGRGEDAGDSWEAPGRASR